MTTAPPPLDTVQAFVNTRRIHHDPREATDALGDPAGVARWLRATEGATGPVSDADVALVAAAREGLRGRLAAPCGAEADDDAAAIARLDALATELPLHVTFGSDPIVPGGSDPVRRALARLLAATVPARADGTWSRLRICRAPDCREAFYDRSRNGSRVWCSMEVCGARAKQRAFVDRRRAARSG